MTKIRWFYAIAAGIILAILAVYPQINLQNQRGEQWQGAFASCDLDEMAYASYLQALIDGRPRRNDPYTGRDDSETSQQPESLFSIQFFPAYVAAVPARVFGLSASEMMPVISAFSAFFTALALFWLIVSITEDDYFAFVGTLIVVIGSALIIGIGAINGFFENGVAYPFFPYLRRYIPSVAFPFMFAFYACLWNGLRAETDKKRAVYSISASLCFAALVFSYFYVWTSAGAVLFGLTLFIALFRTENRRRDLIFLMITSALCLLSLVPYALLLSNRDETMDKAQLLVFTRQPDLLRTVEIIGYLTLTATAFALWRRFFVLKDRRAYFIAAFSFAPLLVFNQQILTARSLQPFHYEFYVINYVVLLAIVLIIAVFWQRFLSHFKWLPVILLSVLCFAAIVWGYVEARETTTFWNSINVQRDEAMPVNLRLRELANADIENARHLTTLNLEPLQADSQTTVAPQSPLWARHQHVFAGLESWEENKQRYYQMLYYSDLDESWLRNSLTNCRNIEACMALFGWDRFNARLSANSRPLTSPEIEAETENYSRFS
ncbi:MAG TPA: hypothetical protein VGD05_03540, partial [Pyrinomonadaceae bacterium]